jgi:hypothetical protein
MVKSICAWERPMILNPTKCKDITMTKSKVEKTGVNSDGKAVTETVMDNFKSSNHAEIKSVMLATIKHAKSDQKNETSDVGLIASATVVMIDDRRVAGELFSEDVCIAALYSAAGYDVATSGPEYSKLSMRVLRGFSAAMLSFQFGFELNEKTGQLKCRGDIAKPTIKVKDAFGHLTGETEENIDPEMQDVPQASYRNHYGVQFPGSIKPRGKKEKKAGASDQVDAIASRDQVFNDLAHEIAEKKMPTSAAAWRLIDAILRSGLTTEDTITGLKNATSGDPSAIDKAA